MESLLDRRRRSGWYGRGRRGSSDRRALVATGSPSARSSSQGAVGESARQTGQVFRGYSACELRYYLVGRGASQAQVNTSQIWLISLGIPIGRRAAFLRTRRESAKTATAASAAGHEAWEGLVGLVGGGRSPALAHRLGTARSYRLLENGCCVAVCDRLEDSSRIIRRQSDWKDNRKRSSRMVADISRSLQQEAW